MFTPAARGRVQGPPALAAGAPWATTRTPGRLGGVGPAGRAAPGSSWLAWIVARWQQGLRRLRQRDAPRDARALLALARTLEGEMPGLAADLRMVAMHRPDGAD